MFYLSFYIVFGIFVSSCRASNQTVVSIIDAFKEVYPKDSFVVFKAARNWRGRYTGFMLAYLGLDDREYIFIAKLLTSTGPKMSKSELKAKAFPFVFETAHEKEPLNRSVTIEGKLGPILPNYYVHVFVANSNWSRHSLNIKGEITFEGRYGSTVDIILT